MPLDDCVICHLLQQPTTAGSNADVYRMNCERCGRYEKDELPKLHFDIRQYNCIDWETPQELARRLKARIEAVIGEGPRKHSV
jgi:hypothetical protein